MTYDQNGSQSKKSSKELLDELTQKEKESHTDRKVRRVFRERLDRLDHKAILEGE